MNKIITCILSLFTLNALAGTSAKDAYQLSIEGKAVLVDVREAEEIREGMIDTAIWFPLSKIKSDSNWKEDFLAVTKGKKIFLYCRSGNRSGVVQNLLKGHSIDSENLGGHMTLKNELPTRKP